MSLEKQLYLIRHGQSMHNFAEIEHKAKFPAVPFTDPFCFDAALSPTGEQQAQGLKAQVPTVIGDDAELVVVSPLSRAINTCLHGFNPKDIPIIVNKECREKLENACDLGSSPAHLAKKFPGLEFNHLPPIWWYTNSDEITPTNYHERWKTHRYSEPAEVLLERISQFKEWLRSRDENKIVIVGHSTFFLHLTGLPEKLNNCQIYSMKV